MMHMVLWMLALFVVSMPEAAGLTYQSRGDDGGDDGGGGGLAGALSGMMGGAGGDDDGGADDDDDANMVGVKKKKKAATGGVDVGGLENGLKTGGVGALTSMLKAMRLAQGSAAASQHIIKGENGEEMYDFRDLDDGTTTTFAPITVTEAITVAPAPLMAIPSAPSISLDGSGKIKGLQAAEVQVAKTEKAFKFASPGGKNHKKLVVLALAAPRMAVETPVVSGAPMVVGAPSFPMAQISTASGTSGLYQGLAMLNQNMNVLMSEAAALSSKATADPIATKLDETSKNFLSYEHKMETRVKVLEDDNSVMRKQINEQAEEIKDMVKKVRARKSGLLVKKVGDKKVSDKKVSGKKVSGKKAHKHHKHMGGLKAALKHMGEA